MNGFSCVVLSEPYVIDDFNKAWIASKNIKIGIGGYQIKVFIQP